MYMNTEAQIKFEAVHSKYHKLGFFYKKKTGEFVEKIAEFFIE